MTVATVPLTYNDFVSLIATMGVYQVQTVGSVVVGLNDPGFDTMIPQALNYAELRIQRDLDILPAQFNRSGYATVAHADTLSIPTDDFVTIQTIIANGRPLLPTTIPFIQNVYGFGSTEGVPKYFAPNGGDVATGGVTTNDFLLGPTPAAVYAVSITGTARLPSLYNFADAAHAGSSLTFISTYYPDLLIQAAMIFVAEYQKNFGRASDDPTMAMTYESMYQNSLKSAMVEEDRKRFEGPAWSSDSPAPIASASR